MDKERKQGLMAVIIVVGFILAAAYCYNALCTNRFRTHGMQGYPYSTFLFRPDDRFMDFLRVTGHDFDPHAQPFPFLLLVHSLLGQPGPFFGLVALFGIFAGVLLPFSWYSLKGGSTVATCRDVLIFTCLSYPVLFAVDRSNLEIMQFVYLVGFLYFYRKQRPMAAAAVLGLALASKPFAIVFLAFFLVERKFLPALITVSVAVALTCFSLLTFPTDVAATVHYWQQNMQGYQTVYVIENEGLFFGHSLFGAWKYLYFLFGHLPYSREWVVLLSQIYFGFAVVIFLSIFAYLAAFRRSLLEWEKWALALFCMTALPFVSADYTLLHYFIPIYLFLNAPKTTFRRDVIVATLFALLLIPKSYLHWTEAPELTITVVLNPLLQLAIVGVIVCRRRAFGAPVPEGAVSARKTKQGRGGMRNGANWLRQDLGD